MFRPCLLITACPLDDAKIAQAGWHQQLIVAAIFTRSQNCSDLATSVAVVRSGLRDRLVEHLLLVFHYESVSSINQAEIIPLVEAFDSVIKCQQKSRKTSSYDLRVEGDAVLQPGTRMWGSGSWLERSLGQWRSFVSRLFVNCLLMGRRTQTSRRAYGGGHSYYSYAAAKSAWEVGAATTTARRTLSPTWNPDMEPCASR